MATSTRELKGRIKVEDLATKEFKKVVREIKNLKKASKDMDKDLNKTRKFKIDADKAQKDIKGLGDKLKDTDKLGNKGVKLNLKDMASKGLELIKGKLNGMGKLGQLLVKIGGKAPALAVLAAIGFAIGKLMKSTYDGVKVWINDATQWTLQKIQNGLAMLKDKAIKVTIEGYNEYSDFKARSKSIKKGMGFKEYDSLMNQTAGNTRGSLKDTRAGVTKLMQMAPDTFGGNAKEAAKFYQTAMQSFRIGGASSEEASSAMYQMNQGLASGALQGDELRSVRENAPLMAKMIEKELGMGIKEAGKQGLITADVVKKALLNHADEINTQFKNIPLNFKDMWTIAGTFMESNVFTPMYERMQSIFENPALQSFFKNLYSDAEEFMQSFWDLMDQTNFGGIDLSILWDSMGPVRDLFSDIFYHIKNQTPEAKEAIRVFGDVVNKTFEGMRPVMQLLKDVAVDVFQFLKENPDFVKNVIIMLAEVWEAKWAWMQVKMKIANDIIMPVITDISGAIKAIGEALKTAQEAWGKFTNYIQNHQPKVDFGIPGVDIGGSFGGGGGVGALGSLNFAYGKDRVPYDNYPANLHEGERVLTKREANEYNSGRSGLGKFVINMYGTTIREEADIDLMTDRLVKKMKLSIDGGV